MAVILLTLDLAFASGADAASNKAAALRWPGYIDTDLAFSEFFGADHTVTARFMPQHPKAYRGPIITVSNESASYTLGQADYRDDSPSAKAKLLLTVAGITATYIPPDGMPAGKWQHIAVTRSLTGGQTYFSLYVNGMKLCPERFLFCHIQPTATIGVPNGKVRIGRTVASQSGTTQAYGFIDDVGVFTKALTSAELTSLNNGLRLNGGEANLLAGYTFDATTPSGATLPAKLSRPIQMNAGAAAMTVSTNRNSTADAQVLPPPHPLFSAAFKLPFKSGQAWKVSQGYEGVESHNGPAAFAYDFVLSGQQSANKVANPNAPGQASCGEPVLAAASGTVVAASDGGGTPEDAQDPKNDGINNDYDGANYVTVEHAWYDRTVYMHLFTGSVQQALGPVLFWPPTGATIGVSTEEQLGTVGTRNNCHLHFRGGTANATKPVAFWGYQACDANCASSSSWYHVAYGVPKQGQEVRRPT